MPLLPSITASLREDLAVILESFSSFEEDPELERLGGDPSGATPSCASSTARCAEG